MPAIARATSSPTRTKASPRKPARTTKAKARTGAKAKPQPKSKPRAKPKPKPKARPKKVRRTAKTADRHELYQLSVQAPETDAPFIARYFERYVGRPARTLREDFCGTGLFAAYWVGMHPENRAIGVDLDTATLAWGHEHIVMKKLDEQQRSRLRLIESDVRTVEAEPVDIVTVFNFSYSLLMTRADLRGYFERVRQSLTPGGLIMIDAWGGSETIEDREESRKVEDFEYVWQQKSFDPFTHHSDCRIHFRFKDGTELKNAFTYEWRQWTMPELLELLTEAGFKDVHVLWEGTDKKTGEGNGVFTRKQRGEADPSWICYVIGQA